MPIQKKTETSKEMDESLEAEQEVEFDSYLQTFEKWGKLHLKYASTINACNQKKDYKLGYLKVVFRKINHDLIF